MNDTAPNPLRCALAFGVFALCAGLGLMSLAGGCARNGQVVTPPPAFRLASAPVLPPVLPKLVSLSWVNAPGACLTDVWKVEGTNRIWKVRITNILTGTLITNTYAITNYESEGFYQVSHPNQVGHYWDTGQWRTNPKLIGAEPK